MWLFADAKIRKDVREHFGGGNVASGNRAEVADHLTDLFAQQVGRQALVEPFDGAVEGFAGLGERRVVAAVRYDGVAVIERRSVHRSAQRPAEAVDAFAVSGREADRAFGQRCVGA